MIRNIFRVACKRNEQVASNNAFIAATCAEMQPSLSNKNNLKYNREANSNPAPQNVMQRWGFQCIHLEHEIFFDRILKK